MNNQVVQANQNQVASNRNQLIKTLRDSLYAGARADYLAQAIYH